MTTPTIEVYRTPPEGFNEKIQVAACYLDVQGKMLFLQRTLEDTEPGSWGVPAGKLEKNETPEQAVRRELYEETGISLQETISLQSLGALYMRKPHIDYVYHSFKLELVNAPAIQLSKEHQNFIWAHPQELGQLILMKGAQEGLAHYYEQSNHAAYEKACNAMRAGASVNAYLILEHSNKILMLLRKNTGYCDGMYGLVAGHVENEESATMGMVREAQEEAGIHILPSQLKVVHIMHRKSNRLNIDIFFKCDSWNGNFTNQEPEKCEKLEYFSLEHLPSNTMDYVAIALKAYAQGQFYSEFGWKKEYI